MTHTSRSHSNAKLKSNEDTHVSLRVVGFDGSPDKITAELGIDPDQQWIKGESINEQGGIHTHSRWAITRPISMEDSLENQLGALLEVLEARADAVRSVAADYEAGICVYGYIREATHPETYLEPETLARLVELNLSLDFDFYAI
jgi:hypothetical protein